MSTSSVSMPLSAGARLAVLAAAFAGLVFDGVELGLMPVASLSVTRSLLGDGFTEQLGGLWFAWYTAALMLGAAVGGIALGSLGDRIGRTRAMGVSILCYSLFAGLGAWVRTPMEMLALRFLVGLGVGGMWPNGVALVAECWSNASRPFVSGVLGAGINIGVLLLSQLTRVWPLTPESWHWIFYLAAVPAMLGLLVLVALPESPLWLAAQASATPATGRASELFRPELRRATIVGIVLASIPLVGAWAASKWIMPWADVVGEAAQRPDYKSTTQGWWAVGAVVGSFVGAPLAARFGRRKAYCLISVGAATLTWAMFQWTAPLRPLFLYVVCAQGFVATLFFGWLPLYLPELFPLRVRAAGSGLAMNLGRFATALGVLAAGSLFGLLGGDYGRVGAAGSFVYALGLLAIAWAPDTTAKTMDE
ncbi:MAG: MFS transporter [Pirellulales bacterium]|nr:MFS transporter [Pirellulales bacterium]